MGLNSVPQKKCYQDISDVDMPRLIFSLCKESQNSVCACMICIPFYPAYSVKNVDYIQENTEYLKRFLAD